MRRKLPDSAGSDDASARDSTVPLGSILCTEELLLRPTRAPDYENESRAFVALAKALADSRTDTLQLLAETILAVTQCDSSGLSLLTKEGDGEYFVRPAIAGVWKPHGGARTPRSCDPSGDVLDRDCALLFRDPQRRYTAFQPVVPAAEECLIVPFYVAGEAMGTVWAVMHTDRRRFDREDKRVMEALAQFASIAHQTGAGASVGKKSKPHSAEQDFRRIADSIPALVYTATPGGEVEFINRQTREYFGCTLEGLKDWGKLIHPDDRSSALNSWRQSLEMGAPWNSEHRLPDAGGVYRWFRQRGVPQSEGDDRCIRWYMLLTEIDQHKNTEERLRESEAFLLHAQRLSLTGSWKHDLSSGEVSITPEMARIYAIQPHEVATTVEFFVNRIHPEDRPDIESKYARALLDKCDFTTDFRIVLGDGSIRQIHNAAHPKVNEGGEVIELRGTVIDVTDQAWAKAELRAIVNTIPTLAWSANPDGACDFLNQQWLDFTGLTPERALGFGWSHVIHPDDAAGLLEYWQAALAAGTHVDVEARMRRSDGIYRWFLFRADPLRDESGQVVKWYGTNFDIEDRKRAEDEVRGNEQKLRAVINTIPTLSWSTRPDGYVEFLSQRWLDFTGLSEEQAKGFGWAVAIHPDDAPGLVEYWQAALASGTHVDVEARLRRFDGVYRWLLFRANPLRDESGQVIKWYGTNFDIEDRKRAEEALRGSEHNLRLIFDTIPALVCTMSAQGELELVNQQTYDYFGISLDELKNWSLIGAVHPDDLDAVVARWHYSVETGEPYSIEHRIRRADGLFRWFQVSGLPLRDTSGRIVSWYVLLVDSEDRQRAEGALRMSERNLRQLTETIPEMLWSATPEGEIDYCNSRFFNYTGFSNEAVMGEGWQKTIHPDDADRVAPIWRVCVATGRPYQVEVRTFHVADGTYRWCAVSALPLLDEHGRILKWHGTIVDVHDAKLAQEKLRHSEAFLAEAQRLSHTGSIGSDLSIDERYWSDETRRIFEFDLSTKITTPMLLERVHPQDMAIVKKNMQLAYAGKEFQFEARLVMPGGAVKYIDIVGHGARALGFRLDFIGAIQDVTQQRLAEQALTKVRSELAHVSRVTSLGTLTASIAHEVNQPLAAVIASADSCTAWLASVPPNLDKARVAADRVIRAATQASEIVQRIRTMIKNTSPSVLAALQVNDIVEEALLLIRTEMISRGVSLSMDLAEDLPSAFGDRVQIAQVVLNLAMNSIEAMVEAGDVERSLAIKTALVGQTEILVSIADNGPGLNAHVTSRLFDPFFTTKATGMGMGLSISRSIVEAHAGRLWSAKNEPRGAVFQFTLPTRATE
jgi:PAS domain S-box-containing protein